MTPPTKSLREKVEERKSKLIEIEHKEIMLKTPNWSFVSHVRSRIEAYKEVLALIDELAKEIENMKFGEDTGLIFGVRAIRNETIDDVLRLLVGKADKGHVVESVEKNVLSAPLLSSSDEQKIGTKQPQIQEGFIPKEGEE